MPPLVPPFLVGLIVAPLAKRLLRPLVSGVIKTSVGIVMEVKKAAHEAGENIHDLAAEVTADVMAAQITTEDAGAHSGHSQHVAGNGANDEVADRVEGDARTPKIRTAAAKAH
ncbi:DUF5132 domain-containing protein [Kitasatospora sp. NPDC008050]|uniref:DUF5132 domain-containing protein n=1 Tax=Kitasatospora sp. NPDC008050 TaxID=3364021 RepID=UPI0036E2C383